MNKERLLRLADLLEEDANNPTGVKFDLGVWAKDADLPIHWDSDDPHLYESDVVVPVSCDTAACAVGLAAISGAFKEDGLEYIIEGGQLSPAFEGEEGFPAVNKFFDIEAKATDRLFTEGWYPVGKRKGKDGELAVAAKIREFVADPDSIN